MARNPAQEQLRVDLAAAGFTAAGDAIVDPAWPGNFIANHQATASEPQSAEPSPLVLRQLKALGLPTTPLGVPIFSNMTLAEKKRFVILIGEDPAQVPDVETFEFGSLRWNQYASILGVRLFTGSPKGHTQPTVA